MFVFLTFDLTPFDLTDQDNLLNSKLNVRMVVGAREFHNLLTYWDFHAQPFLGFTKNAVNRGKHPVCGSPVGENALLMLEVRGEWVD